MSGNQGPPENLRLPPYIDYRPVTVDPALRPNPRQRTGASVIDEGAIEEYGRTYHHFKRGAYLFPNDGEEQNRLDIQHTVLTEMLMDGELHWAPVRPRVALDIGTGTGIWAIELARKYPDCHVVGTDLSAIQPQGAVINFEFFREDADDEWTLGRRFNFIHARSVCCFVKDFRAILQKAYDHLEPGGWIELHEFAIWAETMLGRRTDTAFGKVLDALVQTLRAAGKDPFMYEKIDVILQEIGFEEVQGTALPLCIGAWPEDPKYKRAGRMNQMNVLIYLEANNKILLEMGMTPEEARQLITRAQAEIRSNSLCPFGPFHIVMGRKPMS